MTDKPNENEELEDVFVVETPADAEAAAAIISETMEALIDTADVSHAFGSPIKRGEYTIIPTAEVLTAVGFGVGFGSGEGPAAEGSDEMAQGMGGGGGGGGRTFSRPVAVVISGPEGVRVEPVVDVTKIGLAALTAAGFMLSTIMRLKSGK